MQYPNSKFAPEIRRMISKHGYTCKKTFILKPGVTVSQAFNCRKYYDDVDGELICVWPAFENKQKVLRGKIGYWDLAYKGDEIVRREWKTITVSFTDCIPEEVDYDNAIEDSFVASVTVNLDEAWEYIKAHFGKN